MRAWMLIFALAGCWRGGDQTEVEEPVRPRVKGAKCDEVSGNVHDVIERADDKQLAARADGFAAVVLRRCNADAWSIELRRCVVSAKTVDDASACDKLSTKDQRDAFAEDLEVMLVTEDGQ